MLGQARFDALSSALLFRRIRGGDSDLFGGGEGVEGHGVGFIADCVEAELEAGGGAFGGELVEFLLIVAGNAGVRGIVGVGFGEGGGARAEGAVHEGLEEADVEEGVVGVVRGSSLLKDGQGEVEVEPLGDAEVELVAVLHGFEDEPVLPLGEVLDRGDAVGEGVGDGEVEGFAAGFGSWRWNLGVDEGHGWGLADDAGGVAGGVAINLAANGVGGGRGDAGGEEGGGVGDNDVAVCAVEDGGVTGGDLVEVLAGGQGARRPPGVVPAGAEDPLAGGSSGGVGADAGLHVGEGGGAVEVDGELLLASGGHVGVGIVEAGHDEGAVQVDGLWAVTAVGKDLGVGAGEGDEAIVDAEGGDALGLRRRKSVAGENAAVDEDGVEGAALLGRSDGGECES